MRVSIRGLVASALLVVCASVAQAQFGGGIGGRGGMGGPNGMPARNAMRRPEPMINAVDLVLKHGSELALADSQVARLTVVKSRQDSSLASLRARLDSLGGRRDRDDGGDPLATQGKMQARGEVMLAYRDALKKGRDEAFGVLDKKQRKQAEKLESSLRKEMERDGADDDGPGFGRTGRPG